MVSKTGNNNRFLSPDQINEQGRKIITRMANRAPVYGFTSINTADVGCSKACHIISGLINDVKAPPREAVKQINIVATLLKIGCYLPIIGQIIGIAGLILLNKTEKDLTAQAKSNGKTDDRIATQIKELRQFTSNLKARFVLSTIGLGIIYFPLDIIFSGIYHHDWQQLKKLESELEKLKNAPSTIAEIVQKIENRPEFINELLNQANSAEREERLKQWLVARDTLVVWNEIAKESEIDTENLDPQDFQSLEDTIHRASEFSNWCAINKEKLEQIRQLCLTEKNLTSLPREIGGLRELQSLQLRANQLSDLPVEIGNLNKLKELLLTGNKFTVMPDVIAELTSLTLLDLGLNQLTSLPPEIGKLSCLNDLYLYYNPLQQLPEELSNLNALKTILLDQAVRETNATLLAKMRL